MSSDNVCKEKQDRGRGVGDTGSKKVGCLSFLINSEVQEGPAQEESLEQSCRLGAESPRVWWRAFQTVAGSAKALTGARRCVHERGGPVAAAQGARAEGVEPSLRVEGRVSGCKLPGCGGPGTGMVFKRPLWLLCGEQTGRSSAGPQKVRSH